MSFRACSRSLRHRLFEPEVLAGLQDSHPELEVSIDRRGNGDRVDSGVLEQVLEAGRRLDDREAPLYDLELPGVQVRDR